MSKQDRHLPATIRKQLKPESKTIIICNNDYTSELWEGNYEHPDTQAQCYKDADILFGTEYYQCVALSEITGGKVYNLPHPANVERLKGLQNHNKKSYIAVVWRRYDKFAYVPFLAAKELGLQTVLIGYDRAQDQHWHITESMYDHVVYHTDYDKYTKILAEAFIVYNPYTLHSYDRLGVDCAAMGVVSAGTDRTWAMRHCYPKTMCDPFDVRATKEILKKLCTDKEYYGNVSAYAQHKAQYFGQENAKLRLLNSILDSKEGTEVKGVIEYAESFGVEDTTQPKVHSIQDYITTDKPKGYTDYSTTEIYIPEEIDNE